MRTAGLWLLVACTLVGAIGCHREVYRKRADIEAYQLIDEKVCDSAQHPGRPLRIEVDRHSRLFDPFDADRPPMPADDPRSHQYMHCVDGKRGYPLWHGAGNTNSPENPDWWRYLPLDERGVLVLDADTAVQLALLHSPDYQRQLETLYLSALDVSSERFRFDTQYFGGLQSFYTADGPLRTGQSKSNIQLGTYSSGRRPWSIQRQFTTGADLVVGLANNIVWEFSGPNTQSATTVLDFALVQPLLRNAGRDRVMERLTLSERRLLANVRAFERYRRSFYLFVVTGRGVESGPTRSGGVFGVGLQGFTGLGGGFSDLNIGGGGGGGGGFANNGGVAQAGGFMGLLQDQLQIQNQEENVARLRENLLLLNDTLIELLTTIPDDQETIPRQRLQVAQAQQALLSAQSGLVGQKATFNQSIDRFLTNLGLPPYICVEIRDPMLTHFQLISPELKSRRNQIADVRTRVAAINSRLLRAGKEVLNPDTNLPELEIPWNADVKAMLVELQRELRPIARLKATFAEVDMPGLDQDVAKLQEMLPRRIDATEKLREVYRREKNMICTLLPMDMIDESLLDPSQFADSVGDLQKEISKIGARLKGYDKEFVEIENNLKRLLQESLATDSGSKKSNQPSAEVESNKEFKKLAQNEQDQGKRGDKQPDASSKKADEGSISDRIRNQCILAIQDLIAAIGEDVLAMQLVQARARTESAALPDMDLTAPEALDIARANRRDWANARASLVDRWRLIEYNADNLESTLDFTFSGDVQNTGNNPFDLRSNTGRMRVGLQWDAPLTRLQERNTYRQSLIEYQQARRAYYQYEDGIWQLLRAQIRQLRANQVNFELQRSAVRMAAQQIGLNEDIRLLREARGLSSGPTAARDIIFALNDLLGAQNGFLNIWVNYEVVRRNLDLEMGTMQLTADGHWLDPGAIVASSGPVPVFIDFEEEIPGMIEVVDEVLPEPADL